MKLTAVSGIMLTLLLIGILMLAFNIQAAKASGIIYIRADGSVDPDTAPISSLDNITYTFTDNIYDEIVVERDNIVVDGAGYTLQGTGGGTGIDLSSRSMVTSQNMEIKAFKYGIRLWGSSNNTILGNNITTSSFCYGVYLYSSCNNTISENNITANNAYNYGICLDESSNNSIFNNNIRNIWTGILLRIQSNPSSNNSISRNNIRNNTYGIWLNLSSFNIVSGNNITDNDYGIRLYYYSENNSISGNNITANNEGGIWFYSSSNNSIYHNNFINNTNQVYDFSWDYPSVETSINIWDDGYPSGGNYWSNYTGVDAKNGPNQDQDGSDGIGDTPFVIYENNTDRYPLMGSWTPPPTPVGGIYIPVNKLSLLAPYIGLTTLLAVAVMTIVYVKKRKRELK